ncbi:MAG: hypothetical protein QM705_11920 [Ancrocorticia sp.]
MFITCPFESMNLDADLAIGPGVDLVPDLDLQADPDVNATAHQTQFLANGSILHDQRRNC